MIGAIWTIWLTGTQWQEAQNRIASFARTALDPEYRNAAWHARKLPSPNYSSRNGLPIRFIILHYTASTRGIHGSLRWFLSPKSKASVHYVITAAGSTMQLVPEEKAAWHAGASGWLGTTSINEMSIGIELENSGYDPYPRRQMNALIKLMRDILSRHPVEPRNILGHSDVQPLFKNDPGEFFDWAYLSRHGIGLWPEVPAVENIPLLAPSDSGEQVILLQRRLTAYGYFLPETGTFDELTYRVVVAFQRHFRPERITGRWDADCDTRLEWLLNHIQP